MIRKTDFYIDGAWVAPAVPNQLEVINPADETAFATISLGSAADVDRAVDAARADFPGWSATSREQCLAKLENMAEVYERRSDAMAKAIRPEVGAPITLATRAQARPGTRHTTGVIAITKDPAFEHAVRAP